MPPSNPGRFTEPFEIIFDNQDRYKPSVQAWYPLMKTMIDPEMRHLLPPDPLFRDDVHEAPLQVADFLAWCLRADYDEEANPFQRIAQSLDLDVHPYMRGFVTRAQLAEVYKRIEEDQPGPVDPGLVAEMIRLTGMRPLKRG